MSSHHELSPAMQERYGIQRSSKPKFLLTMILILAFGVVFYLWRITQPPVVGELEKFVISSAHEVQITFRVTRQDNAVAYCVLRAQDKRKTDVGYATLTFPTGSKRFAVTYNLKTESRAVLAQVLGCSDTLPVRVPPPNFPPGVVIPAQEPPGVAPSVS